MIKDLRHYSSMSAADLKPLLDQAAEAYYAGDPIYSDIEYDAALNHYQQLTNTTGAVLAETISAGFEHARHEIPMLSLNKITQSTELAAWTNKVLADFPDASFVVEPKLDGLSLSLVYREGRLFRAVTRGTGVMGDVVTDQALMCLGVPSRVTLPQLQNAEVRGEVVVAWDSFQRLNAAREESGQAKFANPRNLAAGTLKSHSPELVRERCLAFVACDAYSSNNQLLFTDAAMQRGVLYASGFVVVQAWPAGCFNEIVKWLQDFADQRTKRQYPMPTDGAVVKVLSMSQRAQLGNSSTAPNWAVAFKFPPAVGYTTVKAVVWQVGKHGTLTPVAEMTPIELDGSTVSRASLHNIANIRRLNLNIGDNVCVVKANDIIPQITAVPNKAADGIVVEEPTCCPACGGPVVREEGMAALKCAHPAQCPATMQARVEHLLSRYALDAQGIGPVVLANWLADTQPDSLAAVFDGRLEQWARMKLSVKQAHNVSLALEVAKTRTPDRLLYGLTIPHVGRTVSRFVMQVFGSMRELLAGLDSYEEIAGVGPAAMAELKAWFAEPFNASQVRALMACGLDTSMPLQEFVSDKLKGKTICITGSLSREREDFFEIIKKHGGKPSTSVSKKTTYLLVGEDAGRTKLTKAESCGVPIISELDFWQMLESEEPPKDDT